MRNIGWVCQFCGFNEVLQERCGTSSRSASEVGVGQGFDGTNGAYISWDVIKRERLG